MEPPVLLYGHPPPELFRAPAGAVQASPFEPGADDLLEAREIHFASALVLAPPGALERDWVLARVLERLAPGAEIIALGPKDRGGARIASTLRGFGCDVSEEPKRRHRICRTRRPASPVNLEAALKAGAPRLDPGLGLWTQPGVFSWDRLDRGSALLMDILPDLGGRGADFGCGIGHLALRILGSSAVTDLELVDLDRRAIACARLNLADPRVRFRHADVRRLGAAADLDFVVMNPPFHNGGREDKELGVAFIEAAARALKPGGACWLTANQHLPYEQALARSFREVRLKVQAQGYKVYEAIR
jgi:16S rRNA (guanine1207-N2)-methyltransferase